MKRHILLGVLALLAGGLLVWFLIGNPPRATRFQPRQELAGDAHVKRISKESPYMRTER
jgi:hypothetical protein